MKNMIMYYYNLKNIVSYKQNNKFFFRDDNSVFILELIDNKDKVIDIYKVTNNNDKYYKILTNIYNSIFTNIYGRDYILIQKKINSFDLSNEILNFDILVGYDLELSNKPDWPKLWEFKIDYYEYQMEHMIGKYPLIEESFNYFIGMAETAISYFRYNIKSYNGPIVISHKRIDVDNFFNPLYVVFDYKARDVSEYLKYLFWNDLLDGFNIYLFLKKLNFSKSDFIMLFSRMLFPSFYFDVYDAIINDNQSQNSLINIIKNTYKYKKFLSDVHSNINKIVEIPEVDWI